MTVLQKIIELLDKEKVEYKLTEHESVRTSEEAAKIRGVELKTGAKAMVVKSKDTYYLLVLPADRRLDWKKIKSLLEIKEVRMATEEEAEKATDTKVGSIPPFGNILGLKTCFDQGISENEYVNFNPGSKTHSIHMRSDDLIRLVKPTIGDISQS